MSEMLHTVEDTFVVLFPDHLRGQMIYRTWPLRMAWGWAFDNLFPYPQNITAWACDYIFCVIMISFFWSGFVLKDPDKKTNLNMANWWSGSFEDCCFYASKAARVGAGPWFPGFCGAALELPVLPRLANQCARRPCYWGFCRSSEVRTRHHAMIAGRTGSQWAGVAWTQAPDRKASMARCLVRTILMILSIKWHLIN
jgi:hypothetical protein